MITSASVVYTTPSKPLVHELIREGAQLAATSDNILGVLRGSILNRYRSIKAGRSKEMSRRRKWALLTSLAVDFFEMGEFEGLEITDFKKVREKVMDGGARAETPWALDNCTFSDAPCPTSQLLSQWLASQRGLPLAVMYNV